MANVSINDDVLISKINAVDWEFSDENTQYLTHNIHRYSGKFIPQIAKEVMLMISQEGDLILDPYVGSGTTLLEGILINRKCIGIDLNPLAILISKVKTTVVPEDKLNKLEEYFSAFINWLSNDQLSIFDLASNKSFSTELSQASKERKASNWNNKWYQTHVLEQLVLIYNEIEKIEDESCKNIAVLSFSDILRKFSNASSKYPNVMYDKNSKTKPVPARAFLESLCSTIIKVRELNKALKNIDPVVRIIQDSNTKMEIEDQTVDSIITHPPYIGSIPYAEYGVLSLHWLGYDSKKLDHELTGGRRQSKNVVSRFVEDYRAMISESYRVLKKDGFAFFMVGNPTVRGEIVALNDITVELAKNVGFEIFNVCARNGRNRRGNMMGQEFLIFLRKK